MSAVTSTEIRKELNDLKLAHAVNNDLILEKLVGLCNKYSFSAATFASHLDAFLTNNGNISVVGSEHVGKLEQEFVSNRANAMATSNESSSKKQKVEITPEKKPYQHQSISGSKIQSQDQSPQASSNSFKLRTNSGTSVVAMNQALGSGSIFSPCSSNFYGSRCRLTTSSDDMKNVESRYRYMYTSLTERSRALENHMLELQQEMCEMALVSELSPVGLASPDMVWVCGRICCEAAEGKINKQSIVLEGSFLESQGRRVHLDVTEVPEYALYPGQIVLVQGLNASGRLMVAKKLVEGCMKPVAKTLPSTLLDYHHSKKFQEGSALSVVVAAGPFTTSDNLDYEPFQELLQQVLSNKPDVLVLIGPFVDATHSMLSEGEVRLNDLDDEGVATGSSHVASYEMVFRERIIRDGLIPFFTAEEDDDRINTHIIMVPGLTDAHHECVFPQPPFGDRNKVTCNLFAEGDTLGELNIPFSKSKTSAGEYDESHRVHLLSNPCMFRINEVLFGVTSNDALFSLSSDEVSKLSGGANRMSRLAGHMLLQQTFAPQFPAPSAMLSQLDQRQSSHWRMKCNPDVLITPSKLTSMARDVQGTLVVNPGQVAKGTSGGTVANIAIHPLKETMLRDAHLNDPKAPIPHSVVSRSFVDITKL